MARLVTEDSKAITGLQHTGLFRSLFGDGNYQFPKILEGMVIKINPIASNELLISTGICCLHGKVVAVEDLETIQVTPFAGGRTEYLKMEVDCKLNTAKFYTSTSQSQTIDVTSSEDMKGLYTIGSYANSGSGMTSFTNLLKIYNLAGDYLPLAGSDKDGIGSHNMVNGSRVTWPTIDPSMPDAEIHTYSPTTGTGGDYMSVGFNDKLGNQFWDNFLYLYNWYDYAKGRRAMSAELLLKYERADSRGNQDQLRPYKINNLVVEAEIYDFDNIVDGKPADKFAPTGAITKWTTLYSNPSGLVPTGVNINYLLDARDFKYLRIEMSSDDGWPNSTLILLNQAGISMQYPEIWMGGESIFQDVDTVYHKVFINLASSNTQFAYHNGFATETIISAVNSPQTLGGRVTTKIIEIQGGN